MNKLKQALNFLSQGIAVIPLRHRGKEPESSLMGGQWQQYQTTLPTEYQVRNWLFSGWQNYAVVAGWNNLVIIDFDTMELYNLWRAWAGLDGTTEYLAANSFKVRTAHGMHVYFQSSIAEENSKRVARSGGIDVQAQGKYVVGPGSIHPSGFEYMPELLFDKKQAFLAISSVESILPLGIFPSVVSVSYENCGNNTFCDGLSPHFTNDTQTAYDPYANAISGHAEDLVSKVKRNVRIEAFFPNASKSSNNGQWYSVVCPFHDDNRASAWIDIQRQIFGCQVCGMKPYDVINFYSHLYNLSNREAINQLAHEAHVWG